MDSVAKIGCAHGRFQPPHLGHLEYLIESLRRCEYLWIGITQFDIRNVRDVEAAKHRSFPTANPLTYWERITCLRAAIEEQGISTSRFGFIPFPIEDPDKLGDFLSRDAVCFTTIYDDWNRKKIDVLRQHGFNVEILWDRSDKEYTGTSVRRLMANNDEKWKNCVPPSVALLMEMWRIPERLRKLYEFAGS